MTASRGRLTPRRSLERDRISLDRCRRTMQLMRDSLGSNTYSRPLKSL